MEVQITEQLLEIDELKDRIAELEKEVTRLIGAEPITYGTFTVCKNCGQQDPYTQKKPLSFDVMVELGKEVDAVWDVNINGSVWFPSVDAFESFCRAIEERHGIK